MHTLITLGYHCNISILYRKIHLNQPTGVFEWFESPRLQHITNVISVLNNNLDDNVIIKSPPGSIYLLNPQFVTNHYNLNTFDEIFKRRYNRFIDIIKNEEHIFFSRINPFTKMRTKTTKEEIELFIESIRKINPHCKITFLLVDTSYQDINKNTIDLNLNNVFFYHKYFYQNDMTDVYMRQPTIIYDQYKKMLEDVGFYK
jgi:hypothetical protein